MQDPANIPQPGHEDPSAKEELVAITVNTKPMTIPSGKYKVPAFQELVGIPLDYELDEIRHGQLMPVAPESTLHIRGGEAFVGVPRQGQSS